jgi:hypothetical protein
MSLVTWKESTLTRGSGTMYGHIEDRKCLAVYWHHDSGEGGWKVDTRSMPTNKALSRDHYRTQEQAIAAANAFARRWVTRLAVESGLIVVTEP